jgi:hypothetical protein
VSKEPSPDRRKSLLRAALAWGGTATLLGYLIVTTDLTTAWLAFRSADLKTFLAVAVTTTLATYLIDVATVRFLLGRVGIKVGFLEFARVKGASYLLNIVNYNLGLVLMAAVVRKRSTQGWGAAGSPFILLNFIDLAVFGGLALGSILLGMSPFGPEISVIIGVIGGGSLVFIPVMGLATRHLSLPGLPGRILRHDILMSFGRLSTGTFLIMLGFRAGIILVYALANRGFLYSFGVDISIPRLLVFMPILSLISFIPISLSGLGSTQVVMRGFYGPYVRSDMATTDAARTSVIDAFSTASILTVMLLRIVIGLICLPWVSRTLAAEKVDQETHQ